MAPKPGKTDPQGRKPEEPPGKLINPRVAGVWGHGKRTNPRGYDGMTLFPSPRKP